MEFLADTILDYLKDQIHKELVKPDKSKLIYIMPSFSPQVVTRIGESMTDFADSQPKNVRLVFKVSYALGKSWSESVEPIDKQAYEYITQMDWYDSGDHLTSIRNLPRDPEDDLLAIILIGTDQVTDKSSLDDFHKVNTDVIWNDLLKRSFTQWLEKKLELSGIFYEKETLNQLDDILATLRARGLADITQISDFLQQINFSSAQTGKDALHLLLLELRRFKLPFMRKIPFGKGRAFRNYVDDAFSFFKYEDYTDNTKRNKALETINKFREKHQDSIEESIEQDDIQGYSTVNEFLSELSKYIENNDNEIKDRLYAANFVVIRDEILGFKVKNGRVKKETVKKLSGNPVEVVLHALWLTLADFKGEAYYQRIPAHEAIREIIIKSDKFKHDCQGEDAQERSENAKHYIRRLIGGIDKLIEDHISIAISGSGKSDEHVCVSSKLVPEDNEEANYPSARQGEPCLQFKITIKPGDSYADCKVSRDFAWRLPENQPYRVSYELFERAYSEIKSIDGSCLPCFTVPYYNELMLAKDDEEAYRVLLQCVKSEVNHVVNLLDNKDIAKDDPLYSRIQKLAIDYEHFINEVVQNGLFNALRGFPSGLRKSCEDTYSGFLAEKSYFGPILLRAFMLLHERDPKEGKSWYWDEYESSAVITLLHPTLLEMLDKQIVYLFTCFNYLAEKELDSDGARAFQEHKWTDLSELAEIKTPIACILHDRDLNPNTDLRGIELLHRIGNIKESAATLTTRLLLRYDSSEDEEIADTELFRYSKESKLFRQILNDYHSLHPHADDGISIAVFVNDAIQPVIAGIDSFIQGLFETRASERRFSLVLTIFTENQDDASLITWLNEWKDRWSSADSSQKFQHYRNCRILVSQRLVSSERQYEQFQNLISEGLEVDIAFLMHFIKAGTGNRFQSVNPYDVRDRTLLFPILEKAFCALKDPGKTLQRARVLSNRQFRLSTLHSEVMARLRHPNTDPKMEHVILGIGDFSEWTKVVDKLHEKAEWVICIDPCVDERLLEKDNSSTERLREIIGFGSGVGPHGELNYTISTEQFRLSDLKRRITDQVHTLFGPWEKAFSESIAKSMLKEVPRLSGLSIVRATGIDDKGIRDFMAYSLTRKLLISDENIICDELISLDAYQHWFDAAESSIRPDLLWLTAFMEEGLMHVKAHLIECKLAQKSEAHEDKAHEQLEKGLQHLMTCFKPRTGISAEDEDRRPDQRYWWLQLHRLIASKGSVSRTEESSILSALERLSEGDFSIEWRASAVAYWTDDEDDEMKSEKYWDFSFDEKQMQINLVSIGREFIKSLCIKEVNAKLPSSEQFIRFETLSKSKKMDETIDSRISDSNELDESLNGDNSTSTRDNTPDIAEKLPDQQVIDVARIPERIFLGTSITGNRGIYWEFGHSELANRHILIFGASGMGKTYTIQAILCELGIVGQNSLIVDYTNGFDDKQIEKIAKKVLHPKQHVVRTAPIPINPFRRQHNIIDDNDIPETASDVAQRVSGVFNEVYNFGDQQKSVLYSAIKESLELLNWEMSLPGLVDRLESIAEKGGFLGNSSSTLLSRIRPFVDISPFGQEDPESWEKLFKDPESRCHIIQLATYPKDAARLITEFSLIDLYWYYRGKGSQDTPRVIVLDEIQNLDHRLESPLGQFLTEGRKFGISLILATQTLSNLQKDERDRLFQASHKLFFKPSDTEIRDYAQILQNTTGDKLETWIQRLSDLKKGECYSLGPSLNEANGVLETKSFRVRIDSLENRFDNNK